MTDISLRAVRKTACPSCGADVPIHTRASVQAVCPYCRSTLVRSDLKWEDVGKMAALAEDLSPIRLGMTGRHGSTKFTVIGRLQKQYEDGIWNEWLLALAGNRNAWLGEGSGLYYLTTATTSVDPLPTFGSLAPGQQVKLNKRAYTVTGIEQATCIATEGEIPFAIKPGSSANAADCTGDDGEFATLDYSEYPPQLYTGKALAPGDLVLDGVERMPLRQQKSEELRCLKCGNTLAKLNPDSLTLTCASCCTVHGQSPKGKLIVAWEQAQRSLRPRLPLGRRGRLKGHEYEVIGWMRRRSSADAWDEYLLHHPTQGLRWLIEAEGHWTFMESIPAPAAGAVSPSRAGDGQRGYKHFATYNATVAAVLGEFNWRVKKDERWTVTDYVAPPWILCQERSGKEITWSRGEYLDASVVTGAFGLQNLQPPRGVAACQPGPSIAAVVLAFLLTMMAALAIEQSLKAGALPPLALGTLSLPSNSGLGAMTSEPFVLSAPRGALRVSTGTSLDNHWADFGYALVNQDTGEVRQMQREIAYYWGSDSDGSWSEGRRHDEAVLGAVPPGRYVLEVEAESSGYDWRGNPRDNITATFSVTHPAATGNLWTLFWVLGLGPVFLILWRLNFEHRRWANSDHPWSSE